MGVTAWALVLLVVAALAAGGWHLAHAWGGPGLLDCADRAGSGTRRTALAGSGIAYGPHPTQRLDIVVPEAPGPHPVLVFFHGGGWETGRREDYQFIGRSFAREGFVVAVPGYRLGREGRFPAMMDDAADAIAWVGANIAGLGGDPRRVFLMGHSAGAQMAALVALDRRWLEARGLPPGFVRGVIGLSGPYDFHPFRSEQARRAFGHVADPARTQPIAFARGDAPPMLLLSGDADTVVKPRNSLALAEALTNAGASARVILIPGFNHTATLKALAWPFSVDGRVKTAILEFLAEQGAASAPVQPAP